MRLAGGRDDEETCEGGVRDRVGSLMVVAWLDISSGERLGGVGCGTVVSNSSERSRVEKVRLASSAKREVMLVLSPNKHDQCPNLKGSLTFLKMQFSMWSTLLRL